VAARISFDAAQPQRPDFPSPSGGPALLTLAVVVVVVAGLYFGREILVPLALATLLSFALAPPVRWLRHLGFARLPAVVTVVTFAFLFIVAFGWIVTWQVADLAQRLPAYRYNIETKIETVREAPPGGRFFERMSEMLRDIGRKVDSTDRSAAGATPPSASGVRQEEPKPEPIPVFVQEPAPTPMQLIRTILGPLAKPLATAGIVVVFVVFMLLKREDMRDRFIRLAGSRDLPRTTKAIDDAGQRVGQYLLMQLVVNACYGIPIGIGLWLSGLPNPILWGMLATVLRFVPYIGPIIAAFFPLALAVAVDPGWMTLVWAGALFIIVELITNNVLEPWLYGASTGLSPLAIIAAAIFWTWLWGPIGLLLSTPLTVCLVVLGRHVPQLGFLDVLLGDEPVLTPAQSLYQRLLVGDPDEATERAEEFLAERPLVAFYDEVGIAALALAEHDRVRGALNDEQRMRVVESAMLLIDNLAEHEDAAPVGEANSEAAAAEPGVGAGGPLPGVRGRVALCVGARGNLDETAAAMLGQLLAREGVEVRILPHQSMQTARLKELEIGDAAAVILCYMNADSFAHARFLVRRVRRRFPGATLFVGFFTLAPEDVTRRDPLTATGADRLVTSLREALREVLEALLPDHRKSEPPRPALALASGAER
jgi:predicted PurR-regulated permease PerM